MPSITLLPASRQQELKYLMPRLMQAARLLQERNPELKILLPASDSRFLAVFETALKQYGLRGRVITEQNPAGHCRCRCSHCQIRYGQPGNCPDERAPGGCLPP